MSGTTTRPRRAHGTGRFSRPSGRAVGGSSRRKSGTTIPIMPHTVLIIYRNPPQVALEVASSASGLPPPSPALRLLPCRSESMADKGLATLQDTPLMGYRRRLRLHPARTAPQSSLPFRPSGQPRADRRRLGYRGAAVESAAVEKRRHDEFHVPARRRQPGRRVQLPYRDGG